MKKVVLQTPINDRVTSQLVILYNTFKGVKPCEELEFDLSQVNFFYPLLILSISAYIEETKSSVADIINQQVGSYLEAIRFSKGIDSVTEFEQAIQIQKNYTPISVLKREKKAERERLESMFMTLIYKIIGSIPGAQNAVYYPITELVTNIFDHSKKDKRKGLWGTYVKKSGM